MIEQNAIPVNRAGFDEQILVRWASIKTGR